MPISGLAVNTIARCAFGVDTDAHHNPDDDLIKYGKEVFSAFRPTNWIETILFHAFTYFPGIEKFIPFIPPAYDRVNEVAKNIVEQR